MLNETERQPVDLDLLRLFEAVMREKHVGRAARLLHLSPSAVSHGLRRLRALFGDPLFLRTPKGVVPTPRALQLAQPVGELLAQARQLVGDSRSFVPGKSGRGFTIGALDATATWFLPSLLERIERSAPAVRVEAKHVALNDAFAELDANRVDMVVLPLPEPIPARFEARRLFREEFVAVARSGHPFVRRPGLRSYCRARHLLVSPGGGSRGFIDDALAARGLSRQVSIVVPNFLLGMAILAESGLVGTMPRRVVERHANRFKLRAAPVPLQLEVPRSIIYAAVPKVALLDGGVAWLFGQVQEAGSA